MTRSILNRSVGVISLAAAALMSLPSNASADHAMTSITKQMTCRIRAANERMNRDVQAANHWFREALEQAHCDVREARRNTCHTERRFVERAYQARLAEIHSRFHDKLRDARYQAEVERSAARREFEMARQQIQFERETGAYTTGFGARHPADCDCYRCKAGFSPTSLASNRVPRNDVPAYFVPQKAHRIHPPTDPRQFPSELDVRTLRPGDSVRFNQQSPYLAMLQKLMNR